MRIPLILIPFVLIFFSLIFISCSDDPSSLGKDFLNEDEIEVLFFDTQTSIVNQTSGSYKRALPLGSSERILLGRKDGIESSILLQFSFFISNEEKRNDIKEDSAVVIDAKIEMQRNYIYGESSATLDFTAHKINSRWTANGFTSDSLPALQFDINNVATNVNVTDSVTSFKISNALANEWLKSYVDTSLARTYGLILKPTSTSNKIFGYHTLSAFNISDIPTLILVIQKGSVYTDTLRFTPFYDTHVVEGNIPAVGVNDIVVQAGTVVYSKVWFDLSIIPKNAIINNVIFEVTADTNLTLKGNPSLNSLLVSFFEDSTTLALDSVKNTGLSFEDGIYSGNITSYVQRWISENKNHGIMINSSNTIHGVDKFVLRGSSAPVLERPRLKITYTVKK